MARKHKNSLTNLFFVWIAATMVLLLVSIFFDMAGYPISIEKVYVFSISAVLVYYFAKSLFKWVREPHGMEIPREFQISLKTNTRIPRGSMILAGNLLNYQKRRKKIYKGNSLIEKIIVFPFEISLYIFSVVYLFLLEQYVFFCVKVLHLPEEMIFPSYPGKKL